MDAEGGVGVFDGQGSTGVADADADLLAGEDEDAAAADASLDALWFGWGSGRRAGGAGVADAGLLLCGERVGQAAQQGPVGVEEVQNAVVEADGDASAGEVVGDGVCRPARLTRPMALTRRSTSIGAPA
ncbi:hypothetical protein V6U77_29125 [Micromonospora sp. CPCC 205546]|uniref:hypothetical protein n=1 Tax=Micromonospora sp. CPCC 205546 TaxID=3122397 RepID=UPI002FF0EB75